jgi:hypothetical protein
MAEPAELAKLVEPWNSSTEKARELKLKDFGSLEDVRKMAKPIRTARNRYEAAIILKEIIKKGPLTSKSGLTARIPGKSIGKIISSVAVRSSGNEKVHYLAVANIDKLFSNAIEPWKFELNPGKNNQDLKERKYLYAPIEYNAQIMPVKFTVKVYEDESLGNKLYSIEAISTKLG